MGLGHRFGHLDVVRCARRTLLLHAVGRYDVGCAVRTTSTRQGSLRSPAETMTKASFGLGHRFGHLVADVSRIRSLIPGFNRHLQGIAARRRSLREPALV